jgi:hypothetical protein
VTALADIRAGIVSRLRAHDAMNGGRLDAADMRALRRRQIFVEVGQSARRALIAELESVPKEIDGVPVYPTDAFPGWQVVYP